jgi:rhomboid family GlyGly-CTERM serine protease
VTWALSLGAWALLALVAQAVPTEALAWHGSLVEPWRLITAAFVHWTPWHLAMNLAGCAVLALLGWRARLDRVEAASLWLALPLTQLGLLLRPELTNYGGLSGSLHAAAAVAACALLSRVSSRERWIGAGIALGLAVKLLLEQPWGPVLQTVPGLDFPLAPWAHLSGAGAGALAWMAQRVRMK